MHQAAYQQPIFAMQQDYSLYSGGETFEGVTGTGFGLGSAPLPIKGVPAGKHCYHSPGQEASRRHCPALGAYTVSQL